MVAASPVLFPGARLLDEAVARFHELGYLVLRDLTTPDDLAIVSRLLAGLYRRFQELARQRRAHDLGAEEGAKSILEINQTVDLEPALAETETFRRCALVAERLLGQRVEHRFDHAIYKPPFNGVATSWHQDEAYALERRILSAHFWVPLQTVTTDMGCMEFIPGSHRGALWRHRRRDPLRDSHALEVEGVDTSLAVPCPIAAGDATVHFPRTVHFTGPNRTGTPRLAWSLEFGPRRGLGVRLLAKTRLVWRRATR
jgi:ectoine hydroxylase-related dioxygenase (phytanoyl-CoA dioxygenase family)